MNTEQKIRNYAFSLGADLAGIGNIDRCKHAPIMMSPQGLLPTARSVVVMAVHHPDACIELGGETHPQDIGPYDIQYLMNNRLDEMAYRMGTFIEKLGHDAIPIAASNIWRYNEYKTLDAIFAPDVSNIYMPVVAGLADMGYNGLALTPEFGARNRFVTVITDAELTPDPLIPPGTVCDNCMLCRKHCPTKAFDKEVDGENVLHIDEYQYRFPKKNLWRCAWGEHFDLDLDLEIPDVVNEKVILDTMQCHGTRGGEMGQCLKFCLPKERRTWDRDYSRTPVRKLDVEPSDATLPQDRVDEFLSVAAARGAEQLIVHSAEELADKGIRIADALPDAQTAITVVMTEAHTDRLQSHQHHKWGAEHLVNSVCYDLTRSLERVGYRSVMSVQHDQMTRPILAAEGVATGKRHVHANTVITRAAIPTGSISPSRISKRSGDSDAGRDHGSQLASLLQLARDLGADLVGVSSAARLSDIANQLRPVFEDERILDAAGRNHFQPWDPTVSARPRHVLTPNDYIPGAQSVLVFALRVHDAVVRQAGKPPAEAAGPYAFQTYATTWVGSTIAVRLVQALEALGHKAIMSMDLLNTASLTANPRGQQPDGFSNRFAAVAAGLGWLTVNARTATPEFGLRQRFIAVVTDAKLDESPVLSPQPEQDLCATCRQPCIAACPSRAIKPESTVIRIDGTEHSFHHINNRLCDWTKRYALMADSGFKYLGSTTDIDPEGEVTIDKLSAALPQLDPIKNIRPVVVEPCVVACPYSANDRRP